MDLKKYFPLLRTTLFSVLVYAGHKLVFYLNQNNTKWQFTPFNIETVYGFFFVSSIVIIFILIKVKETNIDNVGLVFLWLTCLKMVISYVLFLPILKSVSPNSNIGKINFFIIFALFLTIETFITTRILNNKQ